MLEVHAILQRQRCNENITKKTGTLSDAYAGSQTQGECGSPQERRSSQKCQEAPGNPSHFHRGSGFSPQSEVHFPRGRHPLEGCYL